jgi:hypothetical protein
MMNTSTSCPTFRVPSRIQACELIASKTSQDTRILFAGVVRIAVPGDREHYYRPKVRWAGR